MSYSTSKMGSSQADAKAMPNLPSLPSEILLRICKNLALIDANELEEHVKLRNRMQYMEDRPSGPLYTAYRSVSALAHTCRALHPIATDSEVVARRAV
jgi:hypothetical protein